MNQKSKSQESQILIVPARETYPIRQQVLRPGRPTNECIFDGDEDAETLHLMVLVEGQSAAVASFMKRDNVLIPGSVQYQLRGMAVLPNFQKKNFGKILLRKGEDLLKKKHPTFTIWFNARKSAVGFYEKFGYQPVGEYFMIPDVCLHIVMYRQF